MDISQPISKAYDEMAPSKSCSTTAASSLVATAEVSGSSQIQEVTGEVDRKPCSTRTTIRNPDVQQEALTTIPAVKDTTGAPTSTESVLPSPDSSSIDHKPIAKKAIQRVPDRVNQLRVEAWNPHEPDISMRPVGMSSTNLPAINGPPRAKRLIETTFVREDDQQVFVYAILSGSISENAERVGCTYLKALRAVCPRVEAAYQKHVRFDKLPGHRITHVYVRGARAQGLIDVINWINAHISVNGRRPRGAQNQLLRNITDGNMPMYGYLLQAFAARHLGMKEVYDMRLRTIEHMQYKPSLNRCWQREAEDIRAALLILSRANLTVRPQIIRSIVDSRIDGKLHYMKWSAIKTILDANLDAFGQEIYDAITLERLRRGLPEPRPYISRSRQRSAAATSRMSQNVQYIPQSSSKQVWQPKKENGSSKRRKKAAAAKLAVQTSK